MLGIDDRYKLTRTFGGFSAQCLSKLFLKEFTVLLVITSFGRAFQVVQKTTLKLKKINSMKKIRRFQIIFSHFIYNHIIIRRLFYVIVYVILFWVWFCHILAIMGINKYGDSV